MSRRPRLLLMADAFDNRGGGEVVVAHLAYALRDRWDVAVLTTTRGPDGSVEEDGLPVFRVHSAYHPRLRPLVSLFNPMVGAKVSAIVRRFRPDVVHAWNVHGHLSYDALRRARRAGAPVVLTYQDAQPFCYSKFKCWIEPVGGRGGLQTRPYRPPATARSYRANPRGCRSCGQHYWLFPPRNRLVRAYLRRYVGRPVSVSAALADALAANDLPGATVVHNGLPLGDPALVEADGDRARTRYGWGAEPLLVTGGRLHFFKGQQQAVTAFAQIAARHATARLVILGDRGWFRDSLAAQAADLGLADRVSFPGFLDRAAYHDCLAAASLFLNLSMYLDPFPTVNLEAMALGVPVVGTCYGGTPEAVIDGETGVIVNPYDLEAVASHSLSLLGDADRWARLARAGRERVARLFPVERMAARYEEIYGGVAASRG
jgi:glycosyltransferase involved in cell wall biosynthesis